MDPRASGWASGERERHNVAGHKSGGQNIAVMFNLQLPLTRKPWITFSNPCNKVRGTYFVKEFFARLFFHCVSIYPAWTGRLDSRSWDRNHQFKILPLSHDCKRRKFKRLCITIAFVYIYLLNGYRELDSYEEPCITQPFTYLARELNPTGDRQSDQGRNDSVFTTLLSGTMKHALHNIGCVHIGI